MGSIPFHVADIGDEELAAVERCLRQGLLGGDGPVGRQVEAALAELTGSRHVLLVTSCTHALELALLVLDVGPGDEVVCPSFSFPSAANCILQRGARPVFVDVCADTLEIDAEDVARVAGEKTAAVLPVDYAGTGCDIGALRAAAPGAVVVEDAAHGLDAWRDGRHLGVQADAGALSFHATKNVVSGEGGALLLQDDALFRRAEIVREKGTNRAAFLRGDVPYYEWVAQGSSYVLSDLLAAVLQAQLGKLARFRERRAAVRARYDEGLAELFADGRLVPLTVPAGCRTNDHLYVIRTRTARECERLRAHLTERGVSAPFHFVPLHTTSFARSFGPPRSLPVTERAWNTLLRLPIYPSLAPPDQERVLDAVRSGLAGAPRPLA